MIVVPMFAPRMIGMATGTETPPVPTAATVSVVMVVEDWIDAVARTPMSRPMRGLVARSKRCEIGPAPMPCAPSRMR